MSKLHPKIVIPVIFVGLSGLTLLGVRFLIAGAFAVVASVSSNNQDTMFAAAQNIALAIFMLSITVFAAFRVLYAYRHKPQTTAR